MQSLTKNPLIMSALLYREDPRTAICLQRHTDSIPPDDDTTPNFNKNIKGVAKNKNYCTAAPVKNGHHNTSNARFCNLYKSRKTKSTLFLIIFFCAIVFQKSSAIPVTSSGQRLILHTSEYRQRHHQLLLDQWRRQAPPPTPPHHRHHLHHRSVSSSNMQEAEQIINTSTCEKIRSLQRLANMTYITLLESFDKYTSIEFNKKTPEEVLNEWSYHSLQLKHPLTEVLVRNFKQMPERALFESILSERLSKEVIAEEMRKVYAALSTLKFAFIHVTEDRKRNKDRLLHDLNGNRADFDTINKFIDEAKNYINNNLHETQEAMKELDIPLPELGDPEYQFNTDAKVRDWLLASEHLSVIQHLRAFYMYFLKKCEDDAAI